MFHYLTGLPKVLIFIFFSFSDYYICCAEVEQTSQKKKRGNGPECRSVWWCVLNEDELDGMVGTAAEGSDL